MGDRSIELDIVTSDMRHLQGVSRLEKFRRRGVHPHSPQNLLEKRRWGYYRGPWWLRLWHLRMTLEVSSSHIGCSLPGIYSEDKTGRCIVSRQCIFGIGYKTWLCFPHCHLSWRAGCEMPPEWVYLECIVMTTMFHGRCSVLKRGL